MGERRRLETRLNSLQEIGEIMGALKNLSFMETRKLRRRITAQQRVVENMEMAAGDFLSHYPLPESTTDEAPPLFLLIGSERGFCGDFNELLLEQLEEMEKDEEALPSRLLVVGQRLEGRLQDDPRVIASLPGPGVAEEVEEVIILLLDTLQKLMDAGQVTSPLNINILYHQAHEKGSSLCSRRPINTLRGETPAHAYPPLLNLTPEAFFAGLVDQYLFAILHEVFFSSLMAEHQRRLQHLDGALHRLQKRVEEFTVKRNALRQEEITEEIELIVLSAELSRETFQAE